MIDNNLLFGAALGCWSGGADATAFAALLSKEPAGISVGDGACDGSIALAKGEADVDIRYFSKPN
jgi:hypothetical protein